MIVNKTVCVYSIQEKKILETGTRKRGTRKQIFQRSTRSQIFQRLTRKQIYELEILEFLLRVVIVHSTCFALDQVYHEV